MSRLADAAGRVACEVLAEAREARVAGSTSRGLFIRAAGSRWLLFLSSEPWLSPMTVRVPKQIPAVAPETKVKIEPGRLVVAGAEVRVPLEAPWDCPPPSGAPPALEGRWARLRELAAVALAAKGGAGLAPALAGLAGLPAPTAAAEPGDGESAGPPSPPEVAALHRLAAEGTLVAALHRLAAEGTLEAALHRLAAEGTLEAALPLLGLGRGLTPSGDDALLGLLLGWSRWLGGCPWSRTLVEEAYRRTTTLSANLLELAGRGEADERLVAMVDHVMAGTPPSRDWLDWGSSSGVDALAGLAVLVGWGDG